MSEKRVQFNNIVQSQLPSYVRDEFPLISEFLKSYYQALEFKGAPIDLIQNIKIKMSVRKYSKFNSLFIKNESITVIAST